MTLDTNNSNMDNATTNDTNSNNNNWADVVDLQKKNDDDKYYDQIIYSVVKITFAGFAGALVGLSRQNQHAGAKIFQRAVVKGKMTRAPPKLKTVAPQGEDANIPFMWATSFIVFVSILETSRFWSPTTMMMDLYQHNINYDQQQEQPQQQQAESVSDNSNLSSLSLSSHHNQKYLATISDYTLGGSVAGLAGAMSKRQPLTGSSSTSRLELPSAILKTGRRSILLSGVGTGIALGFFAGVCQAGLDYMEDQVRSMEEQEQKELANEEDAAVVENGQSAQQ
ncbi:expressed unknown protein [Seminavis robusta]|uniref:Uncharacterized protein n=1 Tax=Seminavis robusta TaxID=568900 RepID=A0A9N8DM91_9STRA|nr:expressed unknown protein [Seminavis robusta]|eukprot:Sro162_g072730.1 n/a (281) ;mRNA; r:13132-13974